MGPDDRLLEDVSGAAFYVDAEQDERWSHPRFLLDVRDGAAEGFSLEGLERIHFVTGGRGPAGSVVLRAAVPQRS